MPAASSRFAPPRSASYAQSDPGCTSSPEPTERAAGNGNRNPKNPLSPERWLPCQRMRERKTGDISDRNIPPGRSPDEPYLIRGSSRVAPVFLRQRNRSSRSDLDTQIIRQVPKLFALEQGNQAIRHELPVFLPIVRGDCRHAIGAD